MAGAPVTYRRGLDRRHHAGAAAFNASVNRHMPQRQSSRNQQYAALLEQVRSVTMRAHREARNATHCDTQYRRVLRGLYQTWAEEAVPSRRVLILASAIEAGVILGEHFAEMEQPTELEGPWKVLHLAVCRRASRFPAARQADAVVT